MARLFDDTASEYLTNANAVQSSAPFTMACRFYTDDTTREGALMSIGDVSSINTYWVVFTNNGRLYARIANAGAGPTMFTGPGSVSANTWYMGGLVEAASNDHTLYLNTSTTTSSTSVSPSGADTTRLGATANNFVADTRFHSGGLAEAAIWSAALTSVEMGMLTDFFNPLFVRPQSLVAYWSLIRDEDQDRVGGFDMTPINTPSITTHPHIMYPISPQNIMIAGAEATRTPRYGYTLFQIPGIV